MGIFQKPNIRNEAKEWGISVWQHPQILFAIMGLVIGATDILIYFISQRYINDFNTIFLAVVAITLLLFIITFILQNSFQRMAEASKMKTEFISIVSHQLRAPITNLSWAVDAFESENKNLPESQQFKNLKTLNENVHRMKDLVNNLLVASRLEADRLVTNAEKIDLVEAIKNSVKSFNYVAISQKVAVNFSYLGEPIFVNADPVQVNAVIDNLLVNAIRYSRARGEVEIVLEIKGKSVVVFFKDSGYGIPEADKKFLFQKFFRAGNVRNQIPDGSGLGLYIVSGIMKKLKGEVGYSSQENKGSIFWVSFPLKK